MEKIILSLYWISVFFSAVMALRLLHSIRTRGLLIMVPYLWFVLVQEVTLYIGNATGFFGSNAIIYNLYRPLSVLVFVWIYYQIPIMKQYRNFMLWITAIYLVLIVIDHSIYSDITKQSSSLTVLIRGFVISICGILFLSSYFQLDNHAEEEKWHPLIWVTIGVVTFYPVISISLSLQRYLLAHDATIFGLKLYQVIPQLMSIFMYSCFSYAFYLCKRKS